MTPTPAPEKSDDAPMGTSPVSSSTPNRGNDAAAMQQVGVVVNVLGRLLGTVGATSDIGRALQKSISSLSKFVPAGSVTPASEKAMLRKAMMEMQQRNQQFQAVKQNQSQGAKPGGMGGGMPGMPKPPQMAQMPQPGAGGA